MKTTKTKSVSQPKKATSAVRTSKPKKTSSVKYVPNEEEIRLKASEIYFERISRGEHGTPESDWREAEELLKGH